MPLDTLVTGRIATFAGDAGFGWVEAIGIRGGRVAFAGSAVELETRADPHTLRIDLAPGEIAIPGITDAHLHYLGAALALEQLDMRGSPTLASGLAQVAEADRTLPAGAWIQGGGWDQRRWGGWPTAADLDAVAPGRRVALWSFDHHALWASTMTLAAAGIDALTSDPAGGIIRRTQTGQPEGVLLEDACAVVMAQVPPADESTVRRTLGTLGRALLELGVVGVHDPGGVSTDPGLRSFDVYARLAEAGELPIRVHASLAPESLSTAIERGLRSGAPLGADPEGMARVGWLKLFADGTLGSGTAALLAPREGTTDHGLLRSSVEELALLAGHAAWAGLATQIHAIGDAAVRAALDALAPTVPSAPLMPRVEHLQLVDVADRRRFSGLGIAASIQPVHLRDDAETARREWGARAESAGYAWRSLAEAGAVIAFGTDAPVEPIDPWPGIALSVLRRDPSWGADVGAFGPDEALDLATALRAAVLGPALTTRELDRGRLMPGCRADLIVLPSAPREAENAGPAFATVRPRLVMVGGEVAVDR
ncbi:MAG: amidohydrolase [Candidatus Limnocylindrales bacterium]